MAKYNENLWQCSDGFGPTHIHTGRREGVYAILGFNQLERKSLVLYIGRSMVLSGRLKKHPIYQKSFKEGQCPYIKWKWCSNSIELEKKLIKRLQPIYNKNLKNGK